MGLLELIGLRKTCSEGEVDEFTRELVDRFDVYTRMQYFKQKGSERELRRTAEDAMKYRFNVSDLVSIAELYDLKKLPVEKRMGFARRHIEDRQEFDSICGILGLRERERQQVIDDQVEWRLEFSGEEEINKLRANYNLSDSHIADIARRAKRVELVWMKRLGILPQEEIESRYFRKVLQEFTDKTHGYFDVESFFGKIHELGISDERAEAFFIGNIDAVLKYKKSTTIKKEEELYSRFRDFGKAISLRGDMGDKIEELAEKYGWTAEETEGFAVRRFNSCVGYWTSSSLTDSFYRLIEDKGKVRGAIEKALNDKSKDYHHKVSIVKQFIPEEQREEYLQRILEEEKRESRGEIRDIIHEYHNPKKTHSSIGHDLEKLSHYRHIGDVVKEEAESFEPFLQTLVLESTYLYSDKVTAFIKSFNIKYKGFDRLRELQQLEETTKRELQPTGTEN